MTYKKYFLYFLITFLIATIIIPRLVFLNLGPDSRRLSDTNLIPSSLEVVLHLYNHSFLQFLFSDHKYPLLSSYIFIPVILIFYLFNHFLDIFKSPSDFLYSYVLKQTNLFLWTQSFLVLINLLAIAGIIYISYKFTRSSKKSAFYALVFGTLSPFALSFSTQERIHSLLFLFTVLSLWSSFYFLRNKNFLSCFIAFTCAIVSSSIGQSGIPAVILPVAAYCFEWEKQKFVLKKIYSQKFFYWIFYYVIGNLIIGYPAVLGIIFFHTRMNVSSAFISSQHTDPVAKFKGILLIFKNLFFQSEVAATFVLLSSIFLFFQRKIVFEPEEKLAIYHIIAYTILFAPIGWLVSSYFSLAILPSVFFLSSSLLSRLKQKIIIILTFILFAIQFYWIFFITKTAAGGDTYILASRYIISQTKITDNILGSVDSHVLEIALSPNLLEKENINSLSSSDKIIITNNLVGDSTRNYTWFKTIDEFGKINLKKFNWILIDEHIYSPEIDDRIKKYGFKLVKKIISHNTQGEFPPELLSLPSISRYPIIPYLYSIGSNFYIYRKN